MMPSSLLWLSQVLQQSQTHMAPCGRQDTHRRHGMCGGSVSFATAAATAEKAQGRADTEQEGAGAEQSSQDSSTSSKTRAQTSNADDDSTKDRSGGGSATDADQKGEASEDTSSKSPGDGPTMLERFKEFAVIAGREMYQAVLPDSPKASAIRGASAKASNIQTSSVSDLAVAPAPKESAWQRQWKDMTDSLGGHPLFQRLAAIKDSSRVKDMAEAVRERWETSDSPLVHRIQDATDSFFQESEAAQALREIRSRDPGFEMVEFLQRVKSDVPVVIKAYLEGDEDTVKEYCTSEMIERLTGIIRAQKTAGLVPDPTLLDTSEVELVDLKMLEDSPIVVAQFTCQQINCTRDTHGNVVEGGPDEVHRVYYYWALQQEEAGYIGEDGNHHPPRWQLREMLIRGMHHLL